MIFTGSKATCPSNFDVSACALQALRHRGGGNIAACADGCKTFASVKSVDACLTASELPLALWKHQSPSGSVNSLYVKSPTKVNRVCCAYPSTKQCQAIGVEHSGVLVQNVNSSYQLSSARQTWQQAQAKCQSAGGNLAEPYSQEMLNTMEAMMKSSGVNNVWIGARSARRYSYVPRGTYRHKGKGFCRETNCKSDCLSPWEKTETCVPSLRECQAKCEATRGGNDRLRDNAPGVCRGIGYATKPQDDNAECQSANKHACVVYTAKEGDTRTRVGGTRSDMEQEYACYAYTPRAAVNCPATSDNNPNADPNCFLPNPTAEDMLWNSDRNIRRQVFGNVATAAGGTVQMTPVYSEQPHHNGNQNNQRFEICAFLTRR